MNPLCGVGLIFKLIRAASDCVLAVFFPNMIERAHIVNIMAAVEIIEALICWQIFAVVAKMPFAEKSCGIAGGFKCFCHCNFIAEHTVCVAAKLNGVENSCGSKDGSAVNRGINNVIGKSSVRISAGHAGKASGRANGI